MVKEWNNEFCSYNSMKGLLYADWYQSVKDWKEGKILAPLPPVEASIDLFHACQNKCSFCNASRYLEKNLESIYMPDEHVIELVKYLGEWGVKAVCFGGGGESTLHPILPYALEMSKLCGMDNAISTNGINFYKELIESTIANCRWVGVSVDSATKETYKAEKHTDFFSRVIENLKLLVEEWHKQKTNCLVTYKFLIFEKNQYEIYDACKLAKSIGVHEFHCRPCDFSHQGMEEKLKHNPYNKEEILKQFEACHELEGDDFHIFTIMHKFDNNLLPRKDFKQCYASPCCIQLCADGMIYLCPDMRHVDFYKIGSHYPDIDGIKRCWGSRKHYDLVFKIGKDRCNTRCTFAPYNRQCQELFMEDNDPICRWFI